MGFGFEKTENKDVGREAESEGIHNVSRSLLYPTFFPLPFFSCPPSFTHVFLLSPPPRKHHQSTLPESSVPAALGLRVPASALAAFSVSAASASAASAAAAAPPSLGEEV